MKNLNNKTIKERIYNAVKVLSIGIISSLAFSYEIYADSFEDAAKGASEGISLSAKGMLKYLIVIALVIGGLFIAFGTQRQVESVKERAPQLVIGVAMVLGAIPLAALIFGWFN
ncbi:MAG: TrbC/VirB2 family protein [Peptostreptococcaceae bacterium]|nr:TrbC/VirB2 family protein [Peptostreptococcaceae bacterium]MDY5739244.1 TrbC/VirB2 family protein [Anaerovoracaceae bacterium]